MSVKYKCKFQEEWLCDERIKSWLRKFDNVSHDAFCKFCQERFSIAGQGVKQIESHIKGEKHKLKSEPTSTNNNKQKILTFALSKDMTGESSSGVAGNDLAVEESSKDQQMLNYSDKS